MGRQKRASSKSKEQELKAARSREDRRLVLAESVKIYRTDLFIGTVKHIYCDTPTVQCAFIDRLITQMPYGKKGKS
jgi:hypothetical protein